MRRREFVLVLPPPSCYPEIASPAGLVPGFRSSRLSMKMGRSVIRLYAAVLLALASVLVPAPALAQFQPRDVSDPATGEKYHIEGAVGFWFPGTEMQISSTALRIVGTTI